MYVFKYLNIWSVETPYVVTKFNELHNKLLAMHSYLNIVHRIFPF